MDDWQMSFRTQEDLISDWSQDADRAQKFQDVYQYIALLRGGFTDIGYIPSTGLANSFALTGAGEALLTLVAANLPDVEPGSIRLAVATYFSHDDIYVDIDATQVESIHSAFNTEIQEGKIHFPQTYGRALYDRFFETGSPKVERLDYDQTRALFDGMSNAPYQFGKLTVGPLGLGVSASWRNFPPLKGAPLWHCPDPGCVALHTVQLTPAPSGVIRAHNWLSHHLMQSGNITAEWDDLYFALSRLHRDYYGHFNVTRLPWLLSDGFSEDDIRAILYAAFDIDQKVVRDQLAPFINVQRPIHDIVASVGGDAALQGLLILDDNSVCRAIDAAILSGKIDIPVTEKRTPKVMPERAGSSYWKLTPEVGALGFRTESISDPGFALIRLNKLLLYIAECVEGEASRFEWDVRFVQGETLQQKISELTHTQAPESLVRRFILASPTALAAAVDYMQPMYFEQPRDSQQEEELVQRLCWKLGFDPGQYPQELTVFWNRSRAMDEIVKSPVDVFTSARQDEIRGAAVNYFVSLERLFDQALIFTGWALLHDHFSALGSKKFSFNENEARQFVTHLLNQAGTAQPLNDDGRNTLWPLIYNFSFLADHFRSLLAEDSKRVKRPAATMPGFYADGSAPFPFLHTVPLYDVEPSAVNVIIDTLNNTFSELTSINLPNLRNRLEHNRPEADFPAVSEVRSALQLIGNCIKRLEESGLLPLLHLFESLTVDRFGRNSGTLRDYAGRELTIVDSSGTDFGRMPSPSTAQLPLRIARLRGVSDILRFTLFEDSTYQQKWGNYPRPAGSDMTARLTRVPETQPSEEDGVTAESAST